MTEDQRLRAGLPITAGIMAQAIRNLCGADWLERVEAHARQEFAKMGCLGWQMLDTNVLLDIVPLPEPWRGQWGFRLKCAYIQANGDVAVCEFFLPQSEIALAKQRSSN